jgi:hypothetical protein
LALGTFLKPIADALGRGREMYIIYAAAMSAPYVLIRIVYAGITDDSGGLRLDFFQSEDTIYLWYRRAGQLARNSHVLDHKVSRIFAQSNCHGDRQWAWIKEHGAGNADWEKAGLRSEGNGDRHSGQLLTA